MQDPNADTEWNDVLRSKGILPPKEEVTIDEDTVVQVRQPRWRGPIESVSSLCTIYSGRDNTWHEPGIY